MSGKVTTMSFTVEPEFVVRLEKLIAKTGLYHSKSEFLRDAARQRMIQLLGIEEEYNRIREVNKELRKKIHFVRELSQEEKDAIARKYVR